MKREMGKVVDHRGRKLTSGFDKIQCIVRCLPIRSEERQRITMLRGGQSGCKPDGLARQLAPANK
jgi:hypothetical protein